MPDVPQVRLTETPAFKAAVAAAVAEHERAVDDRIDAAVAAAISRLQPAPAAAGGSELQVIDRLAVTIGKMVGQNGTGVNYVDPEITAFREEKRRLLRACLDELREAKDEPLWRLVGQVHIKVGRDGYALVEPYWRDANKRQQQTEIGSYAIPNLAMRPANAAAEKVWSLFTASIGRTEIGDEDQEEWQLTQAGATIRKGVRPPRDATADALDAGDGVRIVRGDDPSKRKVQVFTGMPAIEMAEHAG